VRERMRKSRQGQRKNLHKREREEGDTSTEAEKTIIPFQVRASEKPAGLSQREGSWIFIT